MYVYMELKLNNKTLTNTYYFKLPRKYTRVFNKLTHMRGVPTALKKSRRFFFIIIAKDEFYLLNQMGTHFFYW